MDPRTLHTAKFTPLPGTAVLNNRGGGEYFCGFHQIIVEKPVWIVWKMDMHAACPKCFEQEHQGGYAKALPADSSIAEVEIDLTTFARRTVPEPAIVVCHNGACGRQTKSNATCKICKYPFCHQHLLKGKEGNLCKECEEKLFTTLQKGFCGVCRSPAETWCQTCKISLCQGCVDPRFEYLCRDCGTGVSG